MSIPVAKTKVKNIWIATLKFNVTKTNRGFAETYAVDVAEDLAGVTSGLVNASPTIAQLINFRLVLLGLGSEMFSAGLSTSASGSDSNPQIFQPAGGIALDAESPVADCNMGGDGIQFRSVSLSRKQSHRNALAVRDAWIVKNALTVDIADWNHATYAIPGVHTGQTAPEAIKSWMKVLKSLTMRASWEDGAWTVEPWINVQFSRCVNKSLGASFGSRPSKRRT